MNPGVLAERACRQCGYVRAGCPGDVYAGETVRSGRARGPLTAYAYICQLRPHHLLQVAKLSEGRRTAEIERDALAARISAQEQAQRATEAEAIGKLREALAQVTGLQDRLASAEKALVAAESRAADVEARAAMTQAKMAEATVLAQADRASERGLLARHQRELAELQQRSADERAAAAEAQRATEAQLSVERHNFLRQQREFSAERRRWTEDLRAAREAAGTGHMPTSAIAVHGQACAPALAPTEVLEVYFCDVYAAFVGSNPRAFLRALCGARRSTRSNAQCPPLHAYAYRCGMDPIVGPRFHKASTDATAESVDLCERDYLQLSEPERAAYERCVDPMSAPASAPPPDVFFCDVYAAFVGSNPRAFLRALCGARRSTRSNAQCPPLHAYAYRCGMDPIVGPRFHKASTDATAESVDLCERDYLQLSEPERAEYERIQDSCTSVATTLQIDYNSDVAL